MKGLDFRKLKELRSWLSLLLVLFFWTAAAVTINYGMEVIVRNSFPGAFYWISEGPAIFRLNLLLVLGVILLLYAVIGSLFPSIAVATVLLFLMALISYFKTSLIGEPFYPWDIILNKEGGNIAPLVTGRAAWTRIGAVLVCVAGVIGLHFLLRRRVRLVWPIRVLVGLLSIALLLSFAYQTPWAKKAMSKAGVSDIVWNQQENYKKNGLALTFTMNIKNAIIPKPPGYGDKAMADIAQELLKERGATNVDVGAVTQPERKPNVIFIMNEAFWDPTLLPNVTFSQDPIPNVHRLQKEYPSGYMISPQFGGGTSNVEFEVLTGFSMSFLPGGSVPYQQHIHQPLPSLASFFESIGYQSKAIHSYEGWFWNRENVYKWLGFRSFKSKAGFVQPQYKGSFIADAEVSRSIIHETDNTEDPVFLYAVTMQNHGPYNDTRYGTNSITTESSMNAAGKLMLETFTQGAYDADQSLQMLIDHYEQNGEPTVIVFFGDHLPMLGYGYDVYKQTGYISTSNTEEWSMEDWKAMYGTPFVVWSNFELDAKPIEAVSASFLGSYVLDALSLKVPAQFAYLNRFTEAMPILHRGFVANRQGELFQTAPVQMVPDLEGYKNIQYDLMFGDKLLSKYIDTEYLTQPAKPDYKLDLGK